MQVQLQRNPKEPKGFTASFAWSKRDVETIRKVLGFNWDPKLKTWTSLGPEVLLDMQRFGIGISWMSKDARKIAEEFRQQIWDVMDARSESIEDEEYGYQRQGTDILAAMPNMILGDDLGLGKTKQSLDAVAKLLCSNSLVLCPKTLTYNWVEEVNKWHPEYSVGVLPDNVKERKEFWLHRPDIVCANYEKVRLSDWPFNIVWDAVALDEATRLKNSATVTYKQVKRVVQKAKRTWPITGTPLEKKIEDLYNILSLVRPAILGSYMRFKDQHLICDWSGSITGIKNLNLLRERIAPFMLRRTKAEVLRQLPPKLFNTEYVVLNAEEQEAYHHLTSEFNNWLDEHGVSGGGNPLTEILRMRQWCCTPAIWGEELGRGSKYQRLKELIDEWPGRVVVFCFFEQVISLLHKWLGCHPEALISGKISSSKERIRRVKEFSEGRLGKVFVSTDAGNSGINIVGADLIIHFDQIFNNQRMHQREDRLHRIGQKNVVNVIHLMCLDTVDVGIYKTNKEEEELFKEVVDKAEEALLRKLDAPRLRRLVEGK